MMAMIRSILLLLFIKYSVVYTNVCPSSCKCTENSATCTSTNFTRFEGTIFSLKISKPNDPITIKGGVFNVSELQHLNSISIEQASVFAIDETALKPLESLSSLSFINSTIPIFNNSNVFAAIPKLRTLQLTGCALRKFDYAKSNSLEELNLSQNQIVSINQNTFLNVPYLTLINLDNNLVSSIHPNAFAKLSNLQDVTLAYNNISNIPRDLFQNNTEILSINLSNNPLKEVDFNLNADLEKLVLRSCQLQTFTENFAKNLILLNYLDLSNNSVKLPSGLFDKMTQLIFIDLSRNNLTNLDPFTFQWNIGLQKIILDYNNFQEFPELKSQSNFPTENFSCKQCGIVQIVRDAFKHFPSLITLDLSYNKIGDRSLAIFQQLHSLTKLDLSHNSISRIPPSTFVNSLALTTINLAGNPLKSIDTRIFQRNPSLNTLDVSFCGLQQLWQQPIKANLNSLLRLYIANNSLTSISKRDLEVTPFLQELDVSKNPLSCDEVLHAATSWLIKHNVEPSRNSLKWKTHEELNIDEKREKAESSWIFLIKERCLDEYYFDTLKDDEEEIDRFDSTNKDNSSTFDNDIENSDEDDEYDDDCDDNLCESFRFKTVQKSDSPLLEMVLIFIATALSVLLLVVNIFLYFYRRKLITCIIKVPRVKIPWLDSNNRHKHSGSVYQPLSEEKPESTSMVSDIAAPHMPVLGV